MNSPVLHLCLALLPCLALGLVSKEVGLGVPLPQAPLPLPSSSYEGPPPPTIQHYDTSHYETPQQHLPQQQPSPHQFSYQYQPTTYSDQGAVWVGHDTGLLGGWVDKGVKLLVDVIPVAISVIIILTVLTFLGLIKVPFLTNITEAKKYLGRALANVDVDQLANTVHLAIDKYHQLFPEELD